MLEERLVTTLMLVADLEVKLDSLSHERISHKDDVINEIGNKLMALVPDLIPEAIPYLDFRIGWGAWDCLTSPIGKCIYHTAADPAWDSCIICNQPYERK